MMQIRENTDIPWQSPWQLLNAKLNFKDCSCKSLDSPLDDKILMQYTFSRDILRSFSLLERIFKSLLIFIFFPFLIVLLNTILICFNIIEDFASFSSLP